MISNSHHSHSPYSVESKAHKRSMLKTRFPLPQPIANDKALAHELVASITNVLDQSHQPYKSLTLTRSQPLRIKLVVKAEATLPGPSASDRMTLICEVIHTLVEAWHFPPHLAVKLSGRSMDWSSIAQGLRCVALGKTSVEGAACMAKAISLLGAELCLMPDPKPDIAKALGLLIGLLEQLPIPIRNWTVARLFSELSSLVLSMFLNGIEKPDFIRLSDMVTAARKSYVDSPLHFQPQSDCPDLDAWMNQGSFHALCSEFGVKTEKNPTHASDSADSADS